MCQSVVVHYEELFGHWPPTKFGAPKLPIFYDFATQRQILGPISLVRNMIATIGNSVGNYDEGSPISPQNFMNVGPLTAKNRTLIFAHPPKFCVFRHCRASHTQFAEKTQPNFATVTNCPNIFGSSIPQKWGPKYGPIFDDFATQLQL